MTWRFQAGGCLFLGMAVAFAPAMAQPAGAPSQTPLPVPTIGRDDTILVIGRVGPVASVERAVELQARQVRDLFDQDPAIDIAGGSRNGQRLFLRGIEGSNLAITVDGARQGQNLYNHRGGLLNIDPEFLKRVDIQAGPATADQGPSALGGSIRFETVDAQDRLLDGRRLGAFGRAGYASAAEAKRGALGAYGLIADGVGLLAYGSYTDYEDLRIGGGGRLPFSGGTDRALLVKLSLLNEGPHELRLGFEHNRAEGLNFMQRGDYPWQLQPIDFRARPPQDQRLSRDAWTARYRFHPEESLIDLRANAYHSRNDFFAPNSNGERFISDVTGGDLRNVFGWTIGEGRLETSVGVDYVRDRGTASRSDAGTRYNLNETLGGFVQNRLFLGPLSAYAGARYDDFLADYGPAVARTDAWSFNAGGEVRPWPPVTLFAGYGEAARGNGTLPVHFARNAQPGLRFNGVVGGSLRPERARQWEAGGRTEIDRPAGLPGALRLEATAFETRIANAILYRQPGSGGLGGRPITEIYNFDRTARWEGFELGAEWAARAFASSLRYAAVDVRDLPSEPQFIARAGSPRGDQLVWDTRAAVRPGLVLGYTLRRTGSLDRVPPGQIVYVPKPGYTLHDLSLGWRPARLGGMAIEAAVTNLTDELYIAHSTLTQDGLASQEPGRDVRLSLSYRF